MGSPGVELMTRVGPRLADYPPGSTFGPRDARSYEFVWLLRGRASWSCTGTSRTALELEPGDLLLVRPGMRDFFRWDPDRPTRHAYVHFTLSPSARSESSGLAHDDRPLRSPDHAWPDLPDGKQLGPPDDGGLPPRADWPLVRPLDGRGGPLAALCDHLLWLGEAQPPAWHAAATDTLRLLVMTFVRGPLPDDDGPPLPRPVEAAMAFVAELWADGVARPVPLSELAGAASVSPSSLSRHFRQHFSVGPITALELLRLARAEPLLWMSNLTMTAIAQQCGFTDAYHFSRRFRAAYGVPPSTFRSAGASRSGPSPATDAGLRPLERRLRRATGYDTGAPRQHP